MKVSEMTEGLPPKILIYGPPGTGKTAFAMTAGASAQLLDLDKGWTTARSLKDAFTARRQEVDVLGFYEDDPKKALAFVRCKTKLMEIAELCYQGKYPFKVLVVDSLTALSEFALRFIMGNSGGIYYPATGALRPPEIQHWGLAISEVSNFLLILRSLPIAVVLIAHSHRDQMVEAGGNKQDIIEVAVFGKNLPSKVPAYFDEVLFSKVVEEGGGKRDFVLQTQPTSIVQARTRSQIPDRYSMRGGLPSLLETYYSYKI